MNVFNYQENIQALRAGTALSDADFLATVRAQYQLFDECIILDSSLYDGAFDKTQVLYTDQYSRQKLVDVHSKANINILEEDITNEYKTLTGENFEAVNKYGEVSHFQKTLNQCERQNVMEKTLTAIENNSASAMPIKYRDDMLTAVTLHHSEQTFSESICDVTQWSEQDIKFTNSKETSFALAVASHEVGHSLLFAHTGRNIPSLTDKDTAYNLYIHECMADSFSALDAIHDGMDTSYIDLQSMHRAYSAIMKNDTVHNTCSTLQYIKETVDINYVQNLAGKQEVADYCTKLVLGDKAEGRDPAFLNETAFNKQTETIHSLAMRQKISENEGDKEAPTPLQIKETLERNPHHFTENETAFLQRYIVPHSQTMVHINDVNLGLMTPERFNDPSIMHNENPLSDIAYKESQSSFEDSLQDMLFPLNDDGQALEIPIEEQLHILNKQRRCLANSTEKILECGTDLHLAQEVLNQYENQIHQQLEEKSERNRFSTDERAQEFITPSLTD